MYLSAVLHFAQNNRTMRKLILSFLLIFTMSAAVAQTVDKPVRECQIQDSLSNTFTVMSDDPDLIMPEYKGGEQNMFTFIMHNLKYPVEAMINEESGKVIIEFTIEADGEITDIKVKEKASKLLDEEALRIIQAMPRWTPCEYKGHKMRFVGFTLPIVFRLS